MRHLLWQISRLHRAQFHVIFVTVFSCNDRFWLPYFEESCFDGSELFVEVGSRVWILVRVLVTRLELGSTLADLVAFSHFLVFCDLAITEEAYTSVLTQAEVLALLF